MEPASKSLLNKQSFNGLLLVNKPKGMTSKDVSRFITRLTGFKKMGHVGTLDPMAEGVLPVLFGSATRLQDFFLAERKTYEFDLSFGFETDTLDLEGSVVKRMPFDHVHEEEILKVIAARFLGSITQIPPIYSAIKVKGKPLYAHARASKASEPFTPDLSCLARQIDIFDLNLLSFDQIKGIARFLVSCSKGTYVRSLGADIAAALSTCGTISRLVRCSTGEFYLDESSSIDTIARCWESSGSLNPLLIPIEQTKLPLPKFMILEDQKVHNLLQGQAVFLSKQETALDIHTSDDALFLFTCLSGKAFAIGKISCSGFFWKAQMKRSLL